MTASTGSTTASEIATPQGRRAVVLINAQSGTVRSMGVEAVRQLLETELAKWPQKTEFRIVNGADIEQAVKGLIADGDVSSVIAGGGDGTITSIAGQLAGKNIALGILPLGTMNLMAKSLEIGPDLTQALAQLGSWEWQTNAPQARWSAQLSRMLGRESSDRQHTLATFLDHVPQGERPPVASAFARLLKQGESYSQPIPSLSPSRS